MAEAAEEAKLKKPKSYTPLTRDYPSLDITPPTVIIVAEESFVGIDSYRGTVGSRDESVVAAVGVALAEPFLLFYCTVQIRSITI